MVRTGRNTMQVCKGNDAARCINTWNENQGLKHLSSDREHISTHKARAHETVPSCKAGYRPISLLIDHHRSSRASGSWKLSTESTIRSSE
jgi:hypothetical protein